MTITADSHYRGVNRLSRERFRQIAFERFAQPVLDERDPGEYWDAIIARDCDSLFVLHIFAHESTYGKYGTAQTTHSWGNTRAPSFGAVPVGDVGGRSGTFPIFEHWLDGCISTVARLMTPDWYYTFEQRSIGEVFRDPHYPTPVPGRPIKAPNPRAQDRPVEWAPAGDLNNPAGYLRAVLDGMNRDADIPESTIGGSMTAQIPGFAWYPADADHYEVGRDGQRIRGGAQHYTGGVNSLPWLTSTSGRDDPSARVSAHVLVRRNATLDDRGWQLVRLEDTAWTTAYANRYTVAIEYEHRAGDDIPDGDYEVLAQTWVDIARYVADHGLGIITLDRTATGIRGHREWIDSPHYICPDGIDVDRIAARAAELASPPIDDRLVDPKTGFTILGGFRAYWEAEGGLEKFGRPISNEYDDPADGVRKQWFERARFEWRRGLGLPWDVQLGRVGAEALEARP